MQGMSWCLSAMYESLTTEGLVPSLVVAAVQHQVCRGNSWVTRVTALVQKNVASVETRMKPRLAKTRQTLRTVMAMDVTCMHKFRPGVRMRTLGQIHSDRYRLKC